MEQKKLEFAITKCFFCGGDNGLVFNKILTPKHAKEIKEMHNKVVNMEPCPKCREYMRQGIMFISVANGTDQRNPYRTGNICVIKDEGAKSILPPELFEQVEKRRFCFIEDEVWDKLQLPKGEM